MVIRYILKCTNCGARTLFRIRVGFSDSDPFEFECGRCSQQVRGELHLDQKNVKVLGLANLQGAVEDRHRPEPPTDFAQMHDSYFLVQSASSRPEDFSAFLKAFGRQGNFFVARARSAAVLENVIKERADLVRVIKNYQRGQWDHFRAGLDQFLPELPDDSNSGRIEALLRILDLAFVPFTGSERHKAFITSVFTCVDDCAFHHNTSMRAFVVDIRNRGYLAAAHRESTSLALRTLAAVEELRPLLIDWDPESPTADVDADLKVASVRRFETIKALYVDAYELLCRDLTIGTGLANLRDRGDYSKYPVHPLKRFAKFRPKNIGEFHDAPNAPKAAMLPAYLLYAGWTGSLDSRLRNAIGHNAIVSDTRSGLISYAAHGRSVEMTYPNFLTKVLANLVFVHEFHWLVALVVVRFSSISR